MAGKSRGEKEDGISQHGSFVLNTRRNSQDPLVCPQEKGATLVQPSTSIKGKLEKPSFRAVRPMDESPASPLQIVRLATSSLECAFVSREPSGSRPPFFHFYTILCPHDHTETVCPQHGPSEDLSWD